MILIDNIKILSKYLINKIYPLKDNIKYHFALAEFKGILQSVLSKSSNYRPFKNKN